MSAVADETVGERLKRLRVERGLSQRDLACPGASYAYISRIEAGTRDPSVKALRRVAAKLGVTADYLETGLDRLCVHVGRDVADDLFRSGTRRGGDEFGLAQLDDVERDLLEEELHVALMRAIRSTGFALRAIREFDR